MRLWHVWHRRNGQQVWKHREYRSEEKARKVGKAYQYLGQEVQVRSGSIE